MISARRPALILSLLLTFGFLARGADAANFSETEALFRAGKIAEAEEIAAAEVERGVWNRRWSELLIRCQLDTGKYEAALATYDEALNRYPTSLPLRVLGIEVARYNSLEDRVASEKATIQRYLDTGQLRYATADTLVAAGRYFSRNGIDARIILKSFYDRVLESEPDNLEALVATAELAVDKGDFKVVAETVQKAQRSEVEDARLEHLMAIALAPTDPPAANESLQRALALNPKYTPALILKAEKEIDREDYDAAEATIQSVFEFHPKHPKAIALQAVLAHLAGDFEKSKELRENALTDWKRNPEVDHLIGRKLSDKYRFKEGAEAQRRALTFDPRHVPATFQLAQDLLRLGDEEVGWELADQVHQQDPYNVVAYNLMTLKDRIDGFETLSTRDAFNDVGPGILVRMEPTESQVYGTEVLDLLVEARDKLCEKYSMELKRPVIVEIFPKQNDFAIRTFGLPGGDGFLGVCFGHVITANSPASQGARPSNWKSVLWHEFCHVVTLTKTNNRMPRWLSEGISVYEERLRDPTWGQSMTALYREMILGEDLTPVSQLSGAFLNAPSPFHVQFAYYESSLVVQFLIEKHGLEAMNAVLDGLASGVPINAALAEHIGPLEKLEVEFAEYAIELAESFAPGLDFTRDGLPDDAEETDKLAWAESNPENYWARMRLARDAMQREDYAKAIEHLRWVADKGAATGEQGGVLELLADCYRKVSDVRSERKTLEKLFSVASDALPGLTRYMQMDRESGNWKSVRTLAERALEIQPLAASIHEAKAAACREMEEPEASLRSLNALRALDPVDIAGLDYLTAEALTAAGDLDAAKSHVIDALVRAPRYRDAHRLLLKLLESEAETTAKDDTPKPAEKNEPSEPESEKPFEASKDAAQDQKPETKPEEGDER
ncbi:MAG: tetratricopeptide repeat protein [Planctomycetota bacterium]